MISRARLPRSSAALLSAVLACACSSGEPPPENGAFAQIASGFRSAEAEAAVPRPPVTAAPAVPLPEIELHPRDAAPPIIRGLYVSAYAMGSAPRRKRLLALADSTEINTFVVDVKDEDGIRYRSNYPLAREVSHAKSIPMRDLKSVVDTLRAHDIHAIARIVVFKDARLSRARPEWSIRTPDDKLWIDKAGNSWVSPWDPNVWEYNLRIAEEAARAGFREIQFDYVRFPEAYKSLPQQIHRHAKGERSDAIHGFLLEARRRLHPLGAAVAADLFGLSMNEARDVGIGQQWETLSAVTDVLLPMVYPSHYFPTHLAGVRRPNRMPYETVFASVGMGVIRNQRLAAAGVTPARIVPWLQAFDATWIDRSYRYGPTQLKAQTRAVYELGLEDWILWHPGSNYNQIRGGLEREAVPSARRFVAPATLVRSVDRIDGWGARDARMRAVAGAAKRAD